MNHEESLKGSPQERVEIALDAIRSGNGVIVTDDETRENEGDMIFSSEHLTEEQMALLIREGSGIVCLCLTPDKADELELPLMVEDRVKTVKAASNPDAKPSDLNHPGHVFPLRAREGGVLERDGHTEATIDLMRLAGLNPAGVLCEITLPNGTMARMPDVIEFSKEHDMPVVTIEDIIQYRKENDV